MSDLPLTIPVRDIVVGVLAEVEARVGLDRDEAYLLARLERGESLQQIIEENPNE